MTVRVAGSNKVRQRQQVAGGELKKSSQVKYEFVENDSSRSLEI